MVFNSAEFLLFLPLVVLACYLVPRRLKNLWLLLASYFFYLCWNPAHLPVLLFVTAVAYGTGRLLGVARHPKGGVGGGRCAGTGPAGGVQVSGLFGGFGTDRGGAVWCGFCPAGL